MNKQSVSTVVTKDRFVQALKDLGVSSSMILEVHVSMDALPFVVGGAQTIVDGLFEIIKDTGTIMMPILPLDTKDPTTWQDPNLAPELYEAVRRGVPVFDPRYCKTGGGPVVENFRNRDGVIFSSHPKCCYAAYGRYAKFLCNRQSYHFPLAEESPVARLYELKGYVLNIGCQLQDCTCLHLAEYRSDCRPIKVECSCVEIDGKPQWKRYLDLDVRCEEFNRIRANMLQNNMIKTVMMGDCPIELFSANEAIDELTSYLEKTVVYSLYR